MGTLYNKTENYLNDAVFHPGTIGWFINTKTNLLSAVELMPIVMPMDLIMGSATTFNQLGISFAKDLSPEQRAQLGKYAALLLPQNNLKKSIFDELKSNAAACVDYRDPELESQSTSLLVSAANSLVQHVESVLGFIEYKRDKLPQEKRHEVDSSVRYLFNTTKQFCNDLQDLVNNKTLEIATRRNNMETLINTFKQEFGRIVISFSRIESEHHA